MGSCKRTAYSEGKVEQCPGRLQLEGVSVASTAGLHLSRELILPRPWLSTLSEDLLRIQPFPTFDSYSAQHEPSCHQTNLTSCMKTSYGHCSLSGLTRKVIKTNQLTVHSGYCTEQQQWYCGQWNPKLGLGVYVAQQESSLGSTLSAIRQQANKTLVEETQKGQRICLSGTRAHSVITVRRRNTIQQLKCWSQWLVCSWNISMKLLPLR